MRVDASPTQATRHEAPIEDEVAAMSVATPAVRRGTLRRAGTITTGAFALLLAAACGDDANRVAGPSAARLGPRGQTIMLASFTDREMFQGVMFAEGPVAAYIPELRELSRPADVGADSTVIAAMRAFQDRAMSAVEATYPGLIAAFATDMRSGDPTRIHTSIAVTSDKLVQVVSRMPEVQSAYAAMTADPTLLASLEEDVRAEMAATDTQYPDSTFYTETNTYPAPTQPSEPTDPGDEPISPTPKYPTAEDPYAVQSEPTAAYPIEFEEDPSSDGSGTSDTAVVVQYVNASVAATLYGNPAAVSDVTEGIARVKDFVLAINNVAAVANVLGIVQTVAVAISYAAAVNVAIAVNYDRYVFASRGVYRSSSPRKEVPTAGDGDPSLAHEQLIGSIANYLYNPY
jgi:SdpC family antimicrobial peptide